MFGIVLVCMLPLGLVFYWRSIPPAWRERRVLGFILAGYVLRLSLSSIARDFAFFSYGSGGDSNGYEYFGNMIAHMWSFTGVHYMTEADIPYLGNASLPYNLFAVVAYLNSGPTHIGGVAVAAAIACATALNIYTIACEIGCRKSIAMRIAAAITFLPTFVFYTSDTHKDGLVAFFVFGAFGSAIRLARRFSAADFAVGLASLGGLWLTRYYLVFILWVPFIIGLLGVGAKSLVRIGAVGILIGTGTIVSVAYSTALSRASESVTNAYDQGTAEENLAYTTKTAGSGTVITGSGPSALAQKLAYSLFAPFPWQSGSLGMQLSKVEMIAWYYFVYRSIRAIFLLFARRRSDLLLFALFIVPTIAAYTLVFSNVGLAVRERVTLVLAIMLLASFSWGLAEDEPEVQHEEGPGALPATWRRLRLPSRAA